MNIKISSPGHPDLVKSSNEVQTLLRKKMKDDSVDLFLLNLTTHGKCSVLIAGVTLHFEVVKEV